MHLHITEPNPPRLSSNDDFHLFNVPKDYEYPEDISDYFSLSATSNTLLGRNRAGLNEASCPMILKRLRHPLVLAEVTVSVEFQQLNFDQAGIVVFADSFPGISQPRSTSLFRAGTFDPQPMQGSSGFAKVAFEFCAGELAITTLVSRPNCGADWASTPATPYFETNYIEATSMPSIRLKLERVNNDLWIWFLVPDLDTSVQFAPSPDAIRRQWRKCREVADFFDRSTSKGCWVGCYASRPLESERADVDPLDDALFAEFEDLVIM